MYFSKKFAYNPPVLVRVKYGFTLRVEERSFLAYRLFERGVYEEPESDLAISLVEEAGDYCVDVGAHVGYYTILLASVGAHVLALEPNPQVFDYLKSNVRWWSPVQLQLLDLAAADYDGPTTLYLPSAEEDGWGSLLEADHGDRTHPVAVRACRLEHVIPGDRKVKLLKLDCEGAEALALNGLGSKLQDVENILVECANQPGRDERLGFNNVEWINGILKEFQGHRYDKDSAEWVEVEKAEANDENYWFTRRCTT